MTDFRLQPFNLLHLPSRQGAGLVFRIRTFLPDKPAGTGRIILGGALAE
jgi:hypothetical protein